MNRNAHNNVRDNSAFSYDFLIQIGLHQGSVYFIYDSAGNSSEITYECPEELLHADDFALVIHLRA